METKVLPNIQTHDAFKRTWSEPATIISEDDLREAERLDNTDGDQSLSNAHKTRVTNKGPVLPNIRILSDDLETHKQSETHEMTFKTPQKLQSEYSKRLCSLNSDLNKNSQHSLLCDQSDWMLAERSNSRSPPSPAQVSMSPDIRSRSPMIPRSPSMRTNTNIFNFSPETTEIYKEMEIETRRAKKRLFEEISYASDVSGSSSLTSAHYSGHHSPTFRHRDVYTSPRTMTSRHYSLHEENEPEVPQPMRSPAFRDLKSPMYEPEILTAKRRLDVDCEYSDVSSPKRLQTDLVRKVGFRYLQQLESDISAIRDRLHNPEPEIKKVSNCTCAIMEREFLEMAESAYRSVRRIDASPRGFEQFRRELIQTNEVMKDSMEVLKNIRSFCEHKCKPRD